MTTVAIYTRVSTEHQTVEPQLLELRQYAGAHNFAIAREYTDIISGAKDKRPGLDQLRLDAEAGVFSLVLVVKLDRLGRSVLNVINLVQQLKAAGVSILCTSQGIDNRDDNPCGKMVMGIMASFAEFEKDIIRERTIAGLAVARAKGKRLGKPSRKLVAPERHHAIISEWRASGAGYRELAQRLGGVSPMTAR